MANVNFFSPDGGTTRYPIEDTEARSRIAGQQSLLKDTVGFTGKNLLKNTATTQTINGVTFTVNADKSVTVNGTASDNAIIDLFSMTKEQYYKAFGERDLILNGCPSGGDPSGHSVDWSKYHLSIIETQNTVNSALTDGGDGVTIPASWFANATHNINLRIRISSGQTVSNLTFYPMLRDASITDPTYEPYHESVEVMYEEEIHGVNLLKNEATSQTINGITYTFNENNSVTLNGTSTRLNTQYEFAYRYIATFTGMVRLNGGSSANIHLYPWDCTRNARPYKDSSKTELQTNNQYNSNGDVLFYVEKGNKYGVNPRVVENGTTVSNVTMYPMLRKADIEDSTYRPYNPQAIQNQLNAQGVLGAKNLLKQLHGTETKNGVTFTQNTDGSVTVNGTATINAGHEMITTSDTGINGSFRLPVGRYILSGCPKGGSWGTYSLYFQMMDNNGTWLTQYKDEGDGVEFDITETNKDYRFLVSIRAQNGVAISNVKFYPMIRLASDPDDTYQPYAMTNRELTENTIDLMGNVFRNQRLLTTSDDLNNTNLPQGVYLSQGVEVINKPSDITGWWHLINIKTEGFLQQFIIAGPAIYIRYRGGSPTAWSSWRKFTGTVVS